jgi:hypothetical protein
MARGGKTKCDKCGQIMMGGHKRLIRHKSKLKMHDSNYLVH